MNPDRHEALRSALTTIVFAAALIAIVTVGGAYAPGARSLQQALASTDDWSTFLNSYWFGAAVYFFVRKTYGAIAFALLGFIAAPIVARKRRVVITAAILGGVRVFVEVLERVRYGGVDPALESTFDIAAGTCAAALGAAIRNAALRRRESAA